MTIAEGAQLLGMVLAAGAVVWNEARRRGREEAQAQERAVRAKQRDKEIAELREGLRSLRQRHGGRFGGQERALMSIAGKLGISRDISAMLDVGRAPTAARGVPVAIPGEDPSDEMEPLDTKEG